MHSTFLAAQAVIEIFPMTNIYLRYWKQLFGFSWAIFQSIILKYGLFLFKNSEQYNIIHHNTFLTDLQKPGHSI
jgi:hypothetical protein